MKILLKKKKLLLLVILVALTGIITVYLSFGNLKPTKLKAEEKIPFDKSKFEDINSFTTLNTDKLVSENDAYALYFNEATTHFYVVNKVNGAIWYSNPPIEDDPLASLQAIKDRQKATLIVSYAGEAGNEKTITNYDYSIAHSTDEEDVFERSYAIRYLDDAVQILYTIESRQIDHSYFPQYLTIERFNELYEALGDDYESQLQLEASYRLIDPADIDNKVVNNMDPKANFYELINYDSLRQVIIKILYEIFYNKLGYTFEDLEKDNAVFNVESTVEKPYFEIAIEYRLTDSGVRVSIIRDSIVETKNYRLTRINLLPYFGAADLETEGYFFIPDGSGALMNFNNSKHHLPVYSKRYYGSDLALQPENKPEYSEDLMFPIYGIVNKTQSSALLAIIEKGAPMATLHADVSERNDSYNKIHTSYNFREVELHLISNVGRTYPVPNWTKKMIDTDIVVDYVFLNDEKANYLGLAEAYRNYLIDNKGLEAIDQTRNTVVNLTLLGMFDKKEHILGIPYEATRTLTNFEDAQRILEELIDNQITNINLMYEGWFNDSMDHSIPLDIKINRSMGGEKSFNKFLKYIENQKIDFYPNMNIAQTPNYNKMFDKYRYTSKHINGKTSLIYEYNLATKLIDESQGFNYLISPIFYQSLIDRMLKEYGEFDIPGLSINDLGNQLSGDYAKRGVVYRYQAELYQQMALEQLTKKHDLSLAKPYAYALPYVTNILESPVEGSKYPILDDSIPFYQLVLNGYIDYAGISINQNSDRGLEFHLLKAIETGSNVNFIFSYKDSSILLDTNYNEYYATNYRNWINDVVEIVNELDRLGIHQGTIVNHEILAKGVYLVEYSTGNSFVINYNLSPYVNEALDIVVDGESYILLGGDQNGND